MALLKVLSNVLRIHSSSKEMKLVHDGYYTVHVLTVFRYHIFKSVEQKVYLLHCNSEYIPLRLFIYIVVILDCTICQCFR